MTAKEYLRQAYMLDKRIEINIQELDRVRRLSSSLTSPSFGGAVQTSGKGDASFVRGIEKMVGLEEQINSDIDQLVALRKQILKAIKGIGGNREYIILYDRYISGSSWNAIARRLHASRRTVIRWHDDIIEHFTVPEDAIIIYPPIE